jgi:hypothetical protein
MSRKHDEQVSDELARRISALLWEYLDKEGPGFDRAKTARGSKTRLGLARCVAEIVRQESQPSKGIALALFAGMDNNGNGRRAYLLIDHDGNDIGAIDPGCAGRAKIPEGFTEGPQIRTTPSERNEWLKCHKASRVV